MVRDGQTHRCSWSDCQHPNREGVYPDDLDEQYDGLGIYAGLWHKDCWRKGGASYRNYTREDAYANGERIGDEDDW